MENNKQIKNLVIIVSVLLLVLIVFVIIKKNKKTGDEFIFSKANVSSVDVVLKESFPVQVDVLVEGSLPDECTTLDQNTQNLIGNVFKIDLQTRKTKDGDVSCAQVLGDFQTTIPLENVVGINAGEYVVEVNGVQKNFKMDVDNYISNIDPKK